MTASPISRLICSHDFYWSRKRQADVCRRCGALSPILALHFRSKAAWTVGADLPPERAGGDAPVGPVFADAGGAPAEPPALSSPEAFAPVAEPAPEATTFGSDPFSRPAASAPLTDFSSRDAAPLRHPLVT